jgi:hypothetical protein
VTTLKLTVFEVACPPALSVSETAMEYVPVALGVHDKDEVFDDVQPGGRPE